MRLALASDHAGYQLKQHLVEFLRKQGHEVIDLGVDTDAISTDYPDAARAVGEAVVGGKAERAVLACGSGVGASIAANKIPGVYAAICHDSYSARQGVEHDNMNILCIGGRIIGPALAEELCTAFIGAQFQQQEERFVRRFRKMQAMEARQEE